MKSILFFTLAALLLPAGTMLHAAEGRRPNVLLIVSEDNGPELGCYGDRFARTPNLDQLAAQGVRFANAFVPYSVCSPSRAAYLTGLYPHQNGQIGLATHKFAMYRAETPNFVTLLRAAGYHTGIIGKLHVNPESAFPFDFRALPANNFTRKSDVAEYVGAAQRFWREAAAEGRPWFLSVNFPDAHLPFLRQAHGRPKNPQTGADVKMLRWVGVESGRLREVMADYYNCLARLDEWVGLLLNGLRETGAADDTLVIYLGDHGAQFPRGKGTVYEGGLRVPLIIRGPHGAEAGTVRDELVSTVDLLPTMLQAAGLPHPKELPGWSLLPLLKGARPAVWREYIFGLTTGSFPGACFVQHSTRDARFKLISSPRPETENLDAATYLDPRHPNFVESGVRAGERSTASPVTEAAFKRWERPPRYELYDLQSDPHEWKNLAGDPDYAPVMERLRKALADFQRQTGDPFLDPANVEAYVRQQLTNRGGEYLKQADFHWDYLRDFPVWRSRSR